MVPLIVILGFGTLVGGQDDFKRAEAPRPLADCLRQLLSVRAEERQAAAQEVGRRLRFTALGPGDKEAALAGLVRAVEDRDASVRLAAAQGLGVAEAGPKAVQALQRATNDPDGKVRVVALFGLWIITREEGPLAQIAEALKNGIPDVRRQSAAALGAVHNRKTIPMLLPALQDLDPEVRSGAAHSLRLVCGMIRGEAKESIADLAAALANPDAEVRQSLAGALAGIGPDAKAAVPALIQALKDAEASVRATTAYALGQIRSKTAVPALTEALQDPKGRVRMEAAYALGTIGAEASSANAILHKATHDRFGQVRLAAGLALWRTTSDAKHARAAIKEAANQDPGALVNGGVWLASLGAPGAALLVENLNHPQAKVRTLAADCLASMFPGPKQAVPALIEALNDSALEVRQAAARALQAIDPVAAKKAGSM